VVGVQERPSARLGLPGVLGTGSQFGLDGDVYPVRESGVGTEAAAVEAPSESDSQARLGGVQLGFLDWWKGWPDGGPKRAPIRAYPGYARALAYYLEHTANARGGSRYGSLQDALRLNMPLGQALDIIRGKRQKVHRRDIDAVSSPADCAVLWYGDEDKARPCGCDDNRICPLCGSKEADTLAKDACDFLYGEFLEAVKPKVGKLECMGAAWEIPLHKRLSAELERLMGVEPERYRKEVNRMLGEMWEVIQLAYPEGRIAGYQSVQLYGESNPGEPHFHGHHVLAPVVMTGQVWEGFPPEVRIDDQGRAWESDQNTVRQAGVDRQHGHHRPQTQS